MEETGKKSRYRDMTRGPEWKCILLFALPIMLGQLLQQLYATVDSIVVGNFGPDGALAAVSNCIIVANVFLFVSVGMANGAAILVAQMFGAKQREDMRKSAATALFLLLVMGVASAVIVAAGAEIAIVNILGVRPALDVSAAEAANILSIQRQGITYIQIYAVGLVFTCIYNAVAAILRSVGDSRAVLYFLIVSTVLNTLLDLLFVAVFGWGVAGAAAATVISQFACAAVSLWYMYRNYEEFRLKPKEIRPDREKLRLCMKMGLPSALQQLIVSGGFLFLQRLINSFGPVTINAWAVGHRVDQYICIPPLGMNQGMASFTGQNTGAGRYDRVKRGLRSAVVMDLAMVAAVGAAVYVLAEPLTLSFGVQNLFEGDPERGAKIALVISQAVECLHFLPFAFLIFAFYLPFVGAFNGAGDPGASAIASLASLIIRVAASYIIVYTGFLGWSYRAVWQTYIFGWGASTVYVLIHFRRGKWKTKSLVGTDGAKTEGSAE